MTGIEIAVIILLAVILFLTLALSPMVHGFVKFIISKVKVTLTRNQAKDMIDLISNISSACVRLTEMGNGSLIVIERNEPVDPYLMDSTKMDAILSEHLIVNVFEGHDTPLHDGAMLIRKNRVAYSGAFVRKLTEQKLDKKYGSRHRAGIGLSEQCDALVILTSEERKQISLAINGQIQYIEPKEFYDVLSDYIIGSNKIKEK